jgi:hypothetical protein
LAGLSSRSGTTRPLASSCVSCRADCTLGGSMIRRYQCGRTPSRR